MSQVKTDFTRYLIIIFIIFQVTWTISCSGLPGKKPEPIVPAALAGGDAASARLIRLVSPEENAGFRIKESVKVILEIIDKDKLPDSSWYLLTAKLLQT